MSSTVSTVNTVLLIKSVDSCLLARGVLITANGFANSCGVLLIDGLGGEIYKSDKRNPFFIVLTSEGILLVLIIGLAMLK